MIPSRQLGQVLERLDVNPGSGQAMRHRGAAAQVRIDQNQDFAGIHSTSP
jgi:hypothetical protein